MSPSRILKTGFQYTPVLSMATWVQPALTSQSDKRNKSSVMVENVRAGVREAPDDWRAQLRAGIRAYLETLLAEPVFARAYLLEIHAAGPAALEARGEAMRRFADRYQASFDSARTADPALRPPPREALLVLCGGTEQLLAERVRAGRLRGVRELEDIFCHCAESVLLGPPASHPTPLED